MYTNKKFGKVEILFLILQKMMRLKTARMQKGIR
jgi:hypothetical protein